MIHTWI